MDKSDSLLQKKGCVIMKKSGNQKFGFLEYALFIILILLILFTILSLLWPAITLFYNETLIKFLD